MLHFGCQFISYPGGGGKLSLHVHVIKRQSFPVGFIRQECKRMTTLDISLRFLPFSIREKGLTEQVDGLVKMV